MGSAVVARADRRPWEAISGVEVLKRVRGESMASARLGSTTVVRKCSGRRGREDTFTSLVQDPGERRESVIIYDANCADLYSDWRNTKMRRSLHSSQS
ncbi:hypothetical protein J6590_059321 [Homalodisca vitripennis]|nr:hypothetical protein J6590_059321 [Homalodisca vitripennis]